MQQQEREHIVNQQLKQNLYLDNQPIRKYIPDMLVQAISYHHHP
jgi:hypothetical protein